MRIALAVARFPIVSETFVHDIATALLDRGHDVRILALRGRAPESFRSRDDKIDRYRLVERATFGGRVPSTVLGRWLRVGRLRGSPATILRGLNPALLGRDALTLKALHAAAPFRGTYDVIHAQYADIGARVEQMRAMGVLRGPLVTSMRGNDITGHVGRHGPRLYRRLITHGDYFLPDCDAFRERALTIGFPMQRTETWPAGIDTSRFPLRKTMPPPEPVRLIAVGRLVEKKGFEDALRALARLGDERVRLEFVGDGRLRGTLEALAADLGLGEAVRFRGYLAAREVRARLEASHILLAPSVTGPYGIADSAVVTAKEAMAIGLPVVATRHGGIPELVEDGVSGLLVPERDPEALAGALRRLIASPERWGEMGRAGARIIRERYELGACIDRLLEIYEAVSASSACTDRPS